MGMPRSVALDMKTYLLLKAAEKSPATRAAVPGILATSGFEPEASDSSTKSPGSKSRTPVSHISKAGAPAGPLSGRIFHTITALSANSLQAVKIVTCPAPRKDAHTRESPPLPSPEHGLSRIRNRRAQPVAERGSIK